MHHLLEPLKQLAHPVCEAGGSAVEQAGAGPGGIDQALGLAGAVWA